MDPSFTLFPSHDTRIGFHYYPDSLHYREGDLAAWLPRLTELGASWLVLQSAADRAIPEAFLRGLLRAGIEPVIQFQLSLAEPPDTADLSPILEAYARWGVHGVIFFDRPNARSAWPATGWAQQDLIERFLDRYIPLANLAQSLGLVSIFPALEPGGNYWDTAFLRAALLSLQRRKQEKLIDRLVLAAYAWTGGHSLNWGAGGPESWPAARPYLTPAGSEDQRGFHIADWYQAVSMAVLQKNVPVILLGAGIPGDPYLLPPASLGRENHRQAVQAVAELLAGEPAGDPENPGALLDPLSPHVLACAFWLLADEPDSPFYPQAWYQADESLPAVAVLREWRAGSRRADARKSSAAQVAGSHPIRHYLLLPLYEWGVADWHLEVVRPFIKKFTPTVGFSLSEAALAEKVTVIGNSHTFSEEALEALRRSGCVVERISGDGTSIATQLSER